MSKRNWDRSRREQMATREGHQRRLDGLAEYARDPAPATITCRRCHHDLTKQDAVRAPKGPGYVHRGGCEPSVTLTQQLAALEETDPDVAAAAASYDAMVERVRRG